TLKDARYISCSLEHQIEKTYNERNTGSQIISAAGLTVISIIVDLFRSCFFFGHGLPSTCNVAARDVISSLRNLRTGKRNLFFFYPYACRRGRNRPEAHRPPLQRNIVYHRDRAPSRHHMRDFFRSEDR